MLRRFRPEVHRSRGSRVSTPTTLMPATRPILPLLMGSGLLAVSSLVALAQAAPSPSGTEAASPQTLRASQVQTELPPKQLKEADDAYLRGARALDKGDLPEAEVEFARAVQLAPRNREYAMALSVSRQHRLTDLVQRAAKERVLGMRRQPTAC